MYTIKNKHNIVQDDIPCYQCLQDIEKGNTESVSIIDIFILTFIF